MSQVRRDGELFTDTYRWTPNRSVADSVLWPVPVLQHATVTPTFTQMGVTPGDVLELLGGDREAYLLVVGTPHRDPPETSSSTVVCFNSCSQQLHVLDSTAITQTTVEAAIPTEFHDGYPDGGDSTVLATGSGTVYWHHEDVVEPVADDPVASLAWVVDSPVESDGGVRRSSSWYPYSDQPTPMDPAYPASPHAPTVDETRALEDIENALIHGDAADVLATIPDDTVHGWVTSPPYPNGQRDYEVDGQLGFDGGPDAYLESLLSVVRQAMRVTRQDGTGWLVIDDAISNGSYTGVPDRLVGQLREEGFDVIQNGPWVKQGRKPDPAPNRFAHSHERIIGIAHPDTDYWFHRQQADDETDVLSIPTAAQSRHGIPESIQTEYPPHDARYSVEIVSELLEAAVPSRVCPSCGAPFDPEYEVDILDLDESRNQAKNALDAFHATPEMTRDHARACRAIGLGDTGQSARTQSGTGANTDDVDALVEEVRGFDSFPSSYIREFTGAAKQLTGYQQCCDCPESHHELPGGVVLDPFVGSGTTCVAATQLGRRYTGIDRRQAYLDLADAWLTHGVDSTLTAYTEP